MARYHIVSMSLLYSPTSAADRSRFHNRAATIGSGHSRSLHTFVLQRSGTLTLLTRFQLLKQPLRKVSKIRIAAFRREPKMLGRGNLVAFVGEHSAQVQLSVAQIGANADGFRVFMESRVHLPFTF